MTQANHSLITTLESHLEGLRENGLTRVRWSGPLPQPPEDATPSPPRPRQQVTPPAVPVAEKPAPVMPPPPPARNETVSPSPASTLCVLALERLAECQDSLPLLKTRVVLILDGAELEEPNRSLLSDMLYAIGYGLDQGQPLSWDLQAPLKGQGERLLVMGNDALQATSIAGMDLQIVRGMWQESPHGKLLSTFPPSYLQENPAGKKAAWSDLQKLLKDLELTLPDWTVQKMRKR